MIRQGWYKLDGYASLITDPPPTSPTTLSEKRHNKKESDTGRVEDGQKSLCQILDVKLGVGKDVDDTKRLS